MSLRTSMRVWMHSQTRGAMRCLMLAIADLANDDGIAWPGTACLAEKVNEAPDYTDVLIKKCIESGELIKVSGRGRGHKTRFAVLCGLDHAAQKSLKGVLQNPYSSTPIQRKGVLQKGVLPLEKRGTFYNTKQSPNGASEPGETATVENDILHDPGGSLPPPPLPPTANGGGGESIKKRPPKELTETERFLIDQGMFPKNAREFRACDLAATQKAYKKARDSGSGNGAIVELWRASPPRPAPPPAAPDPPAWKRDDARPASETIAAIVAAGPTWRQQKE